MLAGLHRDLATRDDIDQGIDRADDIDPGLCGCLSLSLDVTVCARCGGPMRILEAAFPSAKDYLAMLALYHAGCTLGLGHTVPLGVPWVDGSDLDHVLITRPYHLQEGFEILPLGDGEHVHVLWVLPISTAERNLEVERGYDALEEHLGTADVQFWNLRRASTV